MDCIFLMYLRGFDTLVSTDESDDQKAERSYLLTSIVEVYVRPCLL